MYFLIPTSVAGRFSLVNVVPTMQRTILPRIPGGEGNCRTVAGRALVIYIFWAVCLIALHPSTYRY
jgi:hypothetical protein